MRRGYGVAVGLDVAAGVVRVDIDDIGGWHGNLPSVDGAERRIARKWHPAGIVDIHPRGITLFPIPNK